MALSVFMHGTRKFQVLNKSVSNLLAAQFKSSQFVITPILAKNYAGLSQTNISKKLTGNSNITLSQSRTVSHSAIWTAEKFVSLALIGIIPTCLYLGGPLCDNLLAVSTTLHMHWGIEAVILDYIRPSLVGHVLPVIAKFLVYIISSITLAGLLYFNINDIGLSQAIRRLWTIKPHQTQ